MMRRTSKRLGVPGLIAVALLGAACGSDADTGGGEAAAAEPPRAAVYTWILVFLGRPTLRRVAYR